MEKPRKDEPMLHFLEATRDVAQGGKPEDSIYRSEARGQQQLVMSDSIPSKWGGYLNEEEAGKRDDVLRQLGFEMGEPFEDDPVFRPAKLPEGWKKSATGHSMHSDIVDAEGFQRVSMFYKAAFYDRSAHLGLNRRVSATYDPRKEFDMDMSYWAVVAKSKGEELIVIETWECAIPERTQGYFDPAGKEAEKAASAYLAEHYPDHMDPLAYWDLDIEGERFTHPPR